MWSSVIRQFKVDVRFIIRDPILTIVGLSPIILILFLKYIFPLLSGFVFSKTGFQAGNYFTIVAITIVSIIPMLFGMVYAFMLLDKRYAPVFNVIAITPADRKNFLCTRMIVPAFISFFISLFSIIITNPVPYEGWLRMLFVSFLLSIQCPFIFLFIGSLAENKFKSMVLSKLYGIFLVAVPLGLLLHHPWNYFMFFSPLYWVSWSWVSSSPVESLIYGTIAMIITFGYIMIFFRHFLKKHTN